ncbi:unnamed protein product [Amoebophrya sp. A120]|nr:unnamed protein product [Amoebophrya sp. A120]|eukprot:GSA120T00022240001.1
MSVRVTVDADEEARARPARRRKRAASSASSASASALQLKEISATPPTAFGEDWLAVGPPDARNTGEKQAPGGPLATGGEQELPAVVSGDEDKKEDANSQADPVGTTLEQESFLQVADHAPQSQQGLISEVSAALTTTTTTQAESGREYHHQSSSSNKVALRGSKKITRAPQHRRSAENIPSSDFWQRTSDQSAASALTADNHDASAVNPFSTGRLQVGDGDIEVVMLLGAFLLLILAAFLLARPRCGLTGPQVQPQWGRQEQAEPQQGAATSSNSAPTTEGITTRTSRTTFACASSSFKGTRTSSMSHQKIAPAEDENDADLHSTPHVALSWPVGDEPEAPATGVGDVLPAARPEDDKRVLSVNL